MKSDVRSEALAMIVAFLGACAAERPTPTVVMVPASSVEAGAPPPRAEGNPDQLEALLTGQLSLVESALEACSADADATARAGLRQAQAALYADRDELSLRRSSNNWKDRDIATWVRDRQKQEDKLGRLAASCHHD